VSVIIVLLTDFPKKKIPRHSVHTGSGAHPHSYPIGVGGT